MIGKISSKQRISMWVGAAVVALAAVGVVGWLLWRLMLLISPNAARAWALLATVLLPVVAWAGWYFGHTEARGRLAGMDQAVDKVMSAATRAAGLRVDTARAMRRVSDSPIVVLPDVEITQRRLPSGGDVIEL